MKTWALLAMLVVAAPADSAEDYASTQADADVQTITTDSSKAYLQARGRLEAHPAIAAVAIRTRLDAVPAPGPSEQRRLLGVLATLGQPEDLPRFAAALRRAIVNADPGADATEVAHPWRMLLLDQGASATTHLQTLVGDDALPLEVRAQLLGDWVGLQPAAATGDMVVLVGRGQPELERELRRTLADRAKRDAAVRAAVVGATDAALDAALGDPPDTSQAARLPALLRFRARVGGDEAALAERLAAVALSDEARFGARVAATRGLGALAPEHTTEPLQALARAQLEQAGAGSQRGEILGWLSLQSLQEDPAASLAARFELTSSDAPRLASLGFALAPVDQADAWLPIALENPWPQVRQAAFERVAAPCSDDTVGLLSSRGSSTDQGGDTDRATARAAVAGLGRCSSPKAAKSLRAILVNTNGDIELRSEAARQLARLGETKPVVDLLRGRPEPAFARRLAAALRHAPESTEDMDATLCAYVEQTGPVARAAADTLRAQHPDSANPCE
jgi:hypothetical protein